MRYTILGKRDKTSLHPDNQEERDVRGDNWTSLTLVCVAGVIKPASAKNNPRPYAYFRGTSDTIYEYLAVPAAFLVLSTVSGAKRGSCHGDE